MSSATLCYVIHCHLQDEMMMQGVDQWISFRVDKNYSADVSTVITRDSDDGYRRNYDYYTFNIQPHQEALFYHLVERDVFYKVNSKMSHVT